MPKAQMTEANESLSEASSANANFHTAKVLLTNHELSKIVA